MLIKPQQSNDKTDISWIQKQALCWVYYPLENQSNIFKKGTVKGIVALSFNKGNSKVMGILENGDMFETKAINLQKCRSSNSLQRDLIDLQIINGAQVLNQLKLRFQQKRIHTYLWNSLIIVNPFKLVPSMYSGQTMDMYINSILIKGQPEKSHQPHVYGFMSKVLLNMRSSQKVQVILISGQSGSGKTQTNKQCLRIISYCCQHIKQIQQHKKKQLSLANTMQNRVLKCDPILQAFGNAKTVKNDNSSRFGKLITLQIDIYQMHILKASIKNFFLEKSRIISQSHGQRNFHIFYQFLKFAPTNLKSKCKLTRGNIPLHVSDFNFLNKDISKNQDVSNDKEMWQQLNRAFQFLKFQESILMNIWEIIASILLIGNLQFDDHSHNEHQACQIHASSLVQSIASLLKIQSKDLSQALLFNKRILADQVMNLPLNKKQCLEGRDSIAKGMYEGLFQWLINEINIKVNANNISASYSPRTRTRIQQVKLLDIYGFEVFQKNSFEQLCVNYTNERIHQIYIEHVFKHEKDILKKEGLQQIISTLNFTDNIKIIEILQLLPRSIYNLLDESCAVNVRDEDFLSNIRKFHEGNQKFPPENNVNIRKSFIVTHTPGNIQYMVQGFREKNKDLLRLDIVEKLTFSKNTILERIFKEKLDIMKNQTNKKFLGTKVRKEVTSLINEMSQNSELNFIRCIKPNDSKLPFHFIDRVSFNQIKYLGILDTIQMRKDSYHVRMPYTKFYEKYGVLQAKISDLVSLSEGRLSEEDCKSLTVQLFNEKFQNKGLQYLFGKNLIFFKMSTQSFLDTLLKKTTKQYQHAATIIKLAFLMKKRNKIRKQFKVNVLKVQRAVRAYMKIAKQVKRKTAVRKIQNAWIMNYQQFFNRKKRKPLMVMQKFIKKVIEVKKGKQKKEAILRAKNILYSAAESHKVSKQYDNHLAMKDQLLHIIYPILWKKIDLHYKKQLSKYLQGMLTRQKNKNIVFRAEKLSRYRQVDKKKSLLQRYILGFRYYQQLEAKRKAILVIQSYAKMFPYRDSFRKLRDCALIIQRNYRVYSQKKKANIRFTQTYFENMSSMVEENFKQQDLSTKKQYFQDKLHRSLHYSSTFKSGGSIQSALAYLDKIKKDRIILFYYLLDLEVLCNIDKIYPQNSWIDNYNKIFQQSINNMNPLQYLDISDTHTVCATTTKIYTWGINQSGERGNQISDEREISVLKQPTGSKLFNITANKDVTVVETSQPSNTIIYGAKKSFSENANKQWATLKDSYVILNGSILTVQGLILNKLNISEKVTNISCGMAHTVVKTSLKKVYSWGQNKKGQLGHGHNHRIKTPKMIEYLNKHRIQINSIGSAATSTTLIDVNNRIWWFGTNSTIHNQVIPKQCLLCQKSEFLDSQQKYTPIRVISKWSKSMSIIGITIAAHEGLFKNQISLRKKFFESFINKWSQNISTVNPPYMVNLSGQFMERHMPIPRPQNLQNVKKQKGIGQQQVRDKLLNEIYLMDQIQKQLLSTRRNNNNNNNKTTGFR